MVSDKVVVADHGNECAGMDAALALVDKTAAYAGFGAQDTQVLRTLAEEMVVGCAAILDVFTGTLWMETDEDNFKILLEIKGNLTEAEREELISLTPDDQNTLPKGFFAKLGVLISNALSGEYAYPYGVAADPMSAEVLWSSAELAQMMADLERHDDPEDKALEKAAKEKLDTLADDVEVAARADQVVVTVYKKLPR